MGASPAVMATLYQGEFASGHGDDRFVRAATIEPRLEQLGQAAPLIRIALRRWKGREQHYDDGRLKLTVADARELVKVLDYLIETAESGA
jgi:hypothetical protein